MRSSAAAEVEPDPAWSPIALIVAVLVVVNLGANRLPEPLYVPWAVASTAVVVLIARRVDRRSWAELGLDRRHLRVGSLVGGAILAVVVTVMVAGALLPATQDLYRDERVADSTLTDALFDALVRVPLGTVLMEEVAFRGVLSAMLLARLRRAPAVAWTALAFGLWHILPAWDIGTVNPTVASIFGDAGRAVSVSVAVAATAVVHLWFWLLRDRTGSLAAPMIAHWATNGAGYLIAHAVSVWA